MRKRCQVLVAVTLSLIVARAYRLHADPGEEVTSKLAVLSFHRQVNPIWGPRRALVMMVSHETLNPTVMDAEWMGNLMEETREIFSVGSGGAFDLQSEVVPEPVLLPGNYADYEGLELLELYAVANGEVLSKYGEGMDSSRFDVLVYFYPTDTNAEPFGMTGASTFGLRYQPAVANIGSGTDTRPEAVAHEIGHGLLFYGHATSADPQSGEVLRWAGDPYDLMGYGLNRNLKPPPDMGLIYRHYWGWTSADEVTPVVEPQTLLLEPGKALLVPTNQNNVLWVELITAEQAYADEAGGVLVRVDRASENGIYHSTLDATPETEFEADLHLTPGKSFVFEGRRIIFLESLEGEDGDTPDARIRVDGAARWITARAEADVQSGPAPLTVRFDATSTGFPEKFADYTWDFSDGEAGGQGLVVSHTFEQPGDYAVRLSVTDEDGAGSHAIVPIRVAPARRLFPFYRQEGGSFTGYAVSNYSEEEANLTFRLFDEPGSLVKEGEMLRLQPGGQLARLGWELFDLPPAENRVGWVELESENPHLGSFFLFGSGSGLDGSVDALRCARAIVFTRVLEGPEGWKGGPVSTWLSLVNPTAEAASVDLTLWVPAASPAGGEATMGETRQLAVVGREIPAHGFLHASIRDLFGVDVSDGIVTATTSGDPALLGFELIHIESPDTTIGLSASSLAEGSRRLFSAQLASQAELVYTSLRLVNGTEQPRRVWLTAISEDGSPLAPTRVVDLAESGIFQVDLGDFFGFDPVHLSVGSLRVDSNGDGILGDVLFGSPDNDYAAAMPLQSRMARQAVFSQVANIPDSFYTGVALHNPQGGTAEITLTVVTSSGEVIGAAEFSLESGYRVSRLLTEWVPSSWGQTGGYVIVEASEPVV